MKITIDTKEDSHEDIKKVISMLQHLVGESALSNQGNIFSDNPNSNDQGVSVFSAMFGDDAPATKIEPSPVGPMTIPADSLDDNKYHDPVELEVY